MKDALGSAFDDFIEGKVVPRQVVTLSGYGVDGECRDVDRVFVSRLKAHGFEERRVGEIELGFEERLPAFVIRDGKAYFGWVFIERFSEKRSRKLFGSVVRNKKGDWLLQVPSNSVVPVYVNPGLKLEMEGERSFVME